MSKIKTEFGQLMKKAYHSASRITTRIIRISHSTRLSDLEEAGAAISSNNVEGHGETTETSLSDDTLVSALECIGPSSLGVLGNQRLIQWISFTEDGEHFAALT